MNKDTQERDSQNTPRDAPKRCTTMGDRHRRRDYWVLLLFCGVFSGSGASVTLANLHHLVLRNFPDILNRFPSYENYLTLSTWIALFGGLLLFVFPMTISAWICRYAVAISILYVILATYGIAELSPVAFHVVYWATLIVAIVSRIGDVSWYRKWTRLDFPIFLFLTGGLVFWAIFEFVRVPIV